MQQTALICTIEPWSNAPSNTHLGSAKGADIHFASLQSAWRKSPLDSSRFDSKTIDGGYRFSDSSKI